MNEQQQQRTGLGAVAQAAQQYRNARWDFEQVQHRAFWEASQKLQALRTAAERVQQAEACLFEAVSAWEQGSDELKDRDH